VNSEQTLHVWLLFYAGVLLDILLQALGSIVAKSNSITSFRVWWQYNVHALGWRLLIDGLCWMLWMVGPHYLGDAAARMIPPVSLVVAPWLGFSADRFTHSLGFILRFSTVEMGIVAPNHVERV
jgi:hypothetical protein